MMTKFSAELTEKTKRLFEKQFGKRPTDEQAQLYLQQFAELGSLFLENLDKLEQKNKE